MSKDARWKRFLRYWDTVYARDFDCVGDLVYEVTQKIKEIKKGKSLAPKE
jgi:hypothetical protein